MFNKSYIALDIGSSTTKIVQGNAQKGEILIREYEIIPTPDNVIKDGKIQNLKLLTETLERVIKKAGMRDKHLVLTVSGTGVITRDIQIPKSTDDEIEKMLEFEAQQYFPVDLENYVLDFKVLEDVTVNDAPYSRVLLVAVPNKQIEEYMKIPGSLKKTISAIDLPANCVLKLLFGKEFSQGKEGDGSPREFAVVDIGAETTGVCIFYGNILRFNRMLLNGGNYIDLLIANEHGMAVKEAEQVKIRAGRASKGIAELDESDPMGKSIKSAADNLVNDVNRFIEFYNSRSAANKLDKIYLCGGGSKLNGLADHMSAMLNIQVEPFMPPTGIKYKGSKGQEKFHSDFNILINAIGALART